MVHENVYDDHIQKKACKDNPNDTPLCPLCEEDITKLNKNNNIQEAWLNHLVH
jgi:hypothetical protein